MAKTKFLVETSAILPVIGKSTANHNQHSRQIIDGAKCLSTTYVRMEFVRRWICDAIHKGCVIRHWDSISDSFKYLSQNFSPRSLKIDHFVIGELWSKIRKVDKPKVLAEEVFSLSVRLLRIFDKHLQSSSNRAKCEIGDMALQVDFKRLSESVSAFYANFMEPRTSCKVNDFLNLKDGRSAARKLVQNPDVAKLKVAKTVEAFVAKDVNITCKECMKLGDFIISLEQQNSQTLLHLDASFNTLCPAQKKKNLQLDSMAKVEHEARPGEWRITTLKPP